MDGVGVLDGVRVSVAGAGSPDWAGVCVDEDTIQCELGEVACECELGEVASRECASKFLEVLIF